MVRDIDQLPAHTFDVLVVGGGIYGLTIAYDAAQRGLAVALIERSDFGSGSSFNHLRTIHGGLRYLQTLDIRRARESTQERRTLARIAPHAVRALPFVLPLHRSLSRGNLAMRAGFMLDRFLTRDRNRGVPPALHIAAGQVVSRDAAIERFPRLPRHGLTGAAIWHEYVTPESDRLTFAWAIAAASETAVLANYVEAVELLRDGRRVVGVRAANRQNGRTIEISARVTVNATGGAVDRLLTDWGAATRMPLLKAMNLVTRREGGLEAVGGRSAGRHLFLVPWRSRAVFGTWESPHACTADDAAPTEVEIAGFISELNEAFPSLGLEMNDVTLVHRGAVPAILADGRIALQGHEQIRDHAAEGIDGIVSVAGVKYTTARAVAERVTDTLVAKLQRMAAPCRTAVTPLPGGDLAEIAAGIDNARSEHDEDLPAETMAHLVAAYGSRYRQVLAVAADRPEWRMPVAKNSPVIGAELVWAARREMVLTLSDAVIRRTPLGALGFPGEAPAQRAAEIVGAELGWSDERRRQELDALRAFYRIG